MKRAMTWLALGGLAAGVWLVVPKARAQENGQGRTSCTNASLKGAYGFYRTGTTSVGPLAAIGIATFDGAGSSTAHQTIRRNGTSTSDLFTSPPITGSYEVERDCTGRFLMPDGTVAGHFVVIDGGKEIFNLSLSAGNSVYGVF